MAADMITQAIVLIIALAALAKAAQYVIENALLLAKHFHISEAAVGFVFISVATSLPELSVSVVSSVAGEGSLSVGNVIGSNIADLTLVLGTCAMVRPLLVKRKDTIEIVQILLITSLIPLVLIYTGNLDKFGGVLLLLIFAAYVYYISKKKVVVAEGQQPVTTKQALRAFLLFSASIVVVLVSSSFVVNAAVAIADMTGIAKSFIGATVVAVGTSLPELAVDLQAVRRRHYSLALGDTMGSAMTNLTLVLGVTGILHPVVLNLDIFLATILFLLSANIIVMYFMTTNSRISRREGVILYALYMLFLLVTAGVQLSLSNIIPFDLPFVQAA